MPKGRVFFIATVVINLLQHNNSREDIECPGDIISYNCSIQSNSEAVQLIWQVTVPGETPLNFTYNSTSIPGTILRNANVRSTLTKLVSNEYIESTLELTILRGIVLNQTELECRIEELNSDIVYVSVNSSSKPNINFARIRLLDTGF
jgi:hypothetical protein